jgi:hypothetical protein
MFFLVGWFENKFLILNLSKSAIFGLLLIIVGIQTFAFTLLLDLERRIEKSN